MVVSDGTLPGPRKSSSRSPRHAIGAARNPSGRTTLKSIPRRPGIFADFFSGFDWDLSFIAYLYYCFAVFTYFLPGADVAMVIAIVTLAVRPNQLRSHPYLLVLVLLVGWAGLTMLNSEYRTDSFQAWWNLVKTALVGIVSFIVIRTRTHLKIALAFLIGCFALFPLRGAFVNYFGGYSTFGRALWNFAYANPNDLAVYCIVFLAFTLALYPLVGTKTTKVALLCVAGLEVLLILFTQSRGSLVAVFIAGGIGLLGQRRRARTFAMVFATVALAAIAAPSGVWERLGGLKNISVDSGMKGVDEEGSAE
ncbi:MAG: hypothetical protein IT353_16735, partial [Gemmatimonadaceae bacterium]|nr:hypothetical protein [Gemmatimonadaceae bacterium]